MKAALYARVSTNEQARFGFSIDAQLDALRSYCSTHHLSIHKIYVDAGVSGKSIHERDHLKMLLEDAKLGNFQHLVIWRLSRLSRSLPDLLDIVDQLNAHNIALVSLNEQFETQTPLGRFTLQMMGAAAQLEREQISENVSLAAIQRTKQGKWNCGNNVLGYRWTRDPGTGEGYVEVVPEEADLVRRIFELYATGDYGYKAITNLLNKGGYRTKKGGLFHINAVRNILSNINYTGHIRYNVKENLRTNGAVPVSSVKGNHPQIIDQDLWCQVQEIQNQRSRPARKLIQRTYPLTGLLKCPQCGQGMIPQHTKAKRKNGSVKMNHYYACGSYLSQGIVACRPNSVRADDIENWFFGQLQALVITGQITQRITTSIQAKQSATSSPLLEQANRLRDELNMLEAERKRLFRAFEDGTIPKEELKALIGSIQARSQELQAMKDDLEQQIRASKSETMDIAKIQSALQQIRSVLQLANTEQQRQFLRLFVDKITLPLDRSIKEARLFGTGPFSQVDVQNLLQEEWRA